MVSAPGIHEYNTGPTLKCKIEGEMAMAAMEEEKKELRRSRPIVYWRQRRFTFCVSDTNGDE